MHSFVTLAIRILSNAHICPKVTSYHITNGQRTAGLSGTQMNGGVHCKPGFCLNDCIVSEPLKCREGVTLTFTGDGGRLVNCCGYLFISIYWGFNYGKREMKIIFTVNNSKLFTFYYNSVITYTTVLLMVIWNTILFDNKFQLGIAIMLVLPSFEVSWN